MDTLYIGYNLAMAREFVDTCAMWARAFVPAAGAVEERLFDGGEPGAGEIRGFRIDFASGFEIAALSSRPRSLRGRQGYVVIDEAAFHDELDELLKAALAMLIWGGKVLVVSTHDGAANPFNRLVEDVRSGRQPGAVVEIGFDDALADGLYRRICLMAGRDWSAEDEAAWRDGIIRFYGDGAEEELFAIPRAGGGAFLPAALLERQQRPGIPVLRWSPPAEFVFLPDAEREAAALAFCEREIGPALGALDAALPSWFGEDFGRSGDLTVIWPVQIGRDMVRRPPFVVELGQVPFAQQKQVLWWVLDRLPRFMGGAMDATGNGAAIAEETATRYGMGRVRQVKISTAWYAEIVPLFKRAFEDALTELPRDLEIGEDHLAIRLQRGVPQIERDGKGRRHGDSAIAHMMALYAARLDGSGGLFDYYRQLAAAPRAAGPRHDRFRRHA
jgi:phage FluMu gp28-like protein